MDRIRLWAERNREERDFRQGELFEQGKGPAPNPGMYYWAVDKGDSVKVPYGEIRDVYSLMYRTTGGPSMVWFTDGIGVVRSAYSHSGTYMRSSSELREFHPAKK